MGDARQTSPARHLQMLLARARNPFDICDPVLERLSDAVLCLVETHGWRHRGAPLPPARCGSYRHTFLLADGSSLSLWELLHDVGTGGAPCHEIYECEEALRRARRRVLARMGTPGLSPCGAPDALLDHLGAALPQAPEPIAAPCSPRATAREDSPDHARRLLRRAENEDRPAAAVRARLAGARHHEIVHLPCPHGGGRVWCSLYEHAFRLADGTGLSLYELEHNMSPTGRLVCEVYEEEAAADRAARLRARERGVEL
jgi:hypothetical protein